MIRVRIDNRLWVKKTDLPPGHEAAIKERLTIANGDKERAIKLRQWGAWDLPDSFPLYEHADPYLVLPRGFAAELRAGMLASGQDIEWDDQTSEAPLSLDELIAQGPTLRHDQEQAAKALRRHRQGVLQAATGAGKTVVVLETWRRSGLRGLILVEKAGLAKQWRDRALEHLGIETGMIGEGEWDEKPLTIAMLQTLHRRETEQAWWHSWGFTACDEVHHVQASTYNEIIRQVCSRFLIGVTATPLEGDWKQPYLTRTLGPIVHITTDEQLRRAGKKMTPLIRRVYTGWRWVPQSAREENYVDTKTIYRCVTKQLEQGKGSTDRIGLIAKTILSQPDACAQLVVSKRLGILDKIRAILEEGGYEGDIYDYRGSVSGDERAEIGAKAQDGGCVILATVADEGVDIPRLDRLHLVWPARKELTLIQQVGRVLRTHPDKKNVIVYDYVDDEGMLSSQAQARTRYYKRAGYPIENHQVSFT